MTNDIEALARRAAGGDLDSARRLVSALEAKSGERSTWLIVQKLLNRSSVAVIKAADEVEVWDQFKRGLATGGDDLDDIRTDCLEDYRLAAYKVAYDVQIQAMLDAYAASRRARDEAAAKADVEADERETLRRLQAKYGTTGGASGGAT